MPLFDPASLRLIAITDNTSGDSSTIASRAAAAVRGGATMIQLRLKNADGRTMLEVARALVKAVDVPIIVNDRTDIAIAAGAAGVHLGAEDMPATAARRIAPAGFLIGVSVGNEAEVDNSREADYVGIGPAFPTGSKDDAGNAIGPDGIAKLALLCRKPAVAIGGINPQNAGSLGAAGVHGIAVISSLYGAADPEIAARELRSAIERWGNLATNPVT